MLVLEVGEKELFSNLTGEFLFIKPMKIEMEHSLISLSAWEEKWNKPLLKNVNNLTTEELVDYFKCMTITKNVPDELFISLNQEEIGKIMAYIDKPMSATWFSDDPNEKPNREVITSELIYFWMIDNGIPFECRKWHLNKLLTLIRVCNIKRSPEKKMSKKDAAAQWRSLNAARRAKYNSKG